MQNNRMTDNDSAAENCGKLTYPALFQNSELRANIICWYPIKPGQKVLLVSEPCAALENCLREMGAEVAVCDINAWEPELSVPEVAGNVKQRNVPEGDGSEKDKLNYDMILHVGVIDAGEKSVKLAWQERMEQYHRLLKEDGELLLAVPNRLGLKYFAGCQDENYDAYFAGAEGYAAGMTKQALGKKEYERAIKQAGYGEIVYYYPYPDYLFPSAIFSEERLPKPGELTDSIRNFDKDRYLLFDEAKVSASLMEEGVFTSFANSFFIVCRKRAGAVEEAAGYHQQPLQQKERVIYTKFSNERAKRFRVRTDIVELENGERLVRKYPLTKAAQEHVWRMAECYDRLQVQAEGTRVRFCPVKIKDGVAESPWVRGEELQQRLQKLLECGDEAAAKQVITAYIQVVRSLTGKGMTDVDLIFPNILVDGDIWHVIDYEWSFEAGIPTEWVLYRGLHYLSIELPGYALTDFSNLLAMAEISPEDGMRFAEWEARFQRFITGDAVPISHMVERLGRQVIDFAGNAGNEERETARRMNRSEKDAKKLFFHLDRVEILDGKAICCGWACAKTRQREYIPAHIAIFDTEGEPIGRPVRRFMRADVADVLKADKDFPYWGFDAFWSFCEDKEYILRIHAGRCQQEILLKELLVEKEERN